MWRILFLTLILFSSTAFAQTQEKPKAYKFDEFGIAGECEYGMRLDTLLMEWDAKQKPKIYIIQYNGVKELPVDFNGRRSRANEKLIKNHFYHRTKIQGLATFIDGGFRERFIQEFWLVPEGAEIPQPSNTLQRPTIPTDETFQFAFDYLMNEYGVPIEFLKAIDRSEKLKAEKKQGIKRNKNGEMVSTEGEILHSDLEGIKFGWIISEFGEILKDRKDSTGTIIFYADNEQYSVKNIRQHVEAGKKKIAKEAKILPNRIQVVFGGFRSMPQAEFWVIPRGGKLPMPTPETKEN